MNLDVIFNASPNSLLIELVFIALTTYVSLACMSLSRFPFSPFINYNILLLFPPSNNLFTSIPSRSIVRLNPSGNRMLMKSG